MPRGPPAGQGGGGYEEDLRKGEFELQNGEWHSAANNFSRVVSTIGTRLKSGVKGGERSLCVSTLSTAFIGRARAFSEIGKPHGRLKANDELLQAAADDARKATSLSAFVNPQSGTEGVWEQALSCLIDVLLTAGAFEQATAELQMASKTHGQTEFMELSSKLEQRILAAKMDADADDGRSPGTFRWPLSTPLPLLPPLHDGCSSPAVAALASTGGWEQYLKARGGETLVASCRSGQCAPLLDGLSFPLSLAWMLSGGGAATLPDTKCGSSPPMLNIVVLGATDRAEVRIFKESSYWQELGFLFSGRCVPRLCFVGPELSVPSTINDEDGTLFVSTAPPCASRFFKDRADMTPDNTVCAVFNGGFGNFVASGQEGLLWSWLPDLEFISRAGFLTLFFCANDYADLKGESSIHATLLGSQFVVAPRRNPFGMATVYSGDDKSTSEGNEWFSGNSFCYATCGRSLENSPRINGRTVSALIADNCQRELVDAVLKCARADDGMQVASAQPPSLLQFEATANTNPLSKPNQIAPKTCRVVIELANVANLRNASLIVSTEFVKLAGVPGVQTILKPWPSQVCVDGATAYFSARRSRLVVRAPILLH